MKGSCMQNNELLTKRLVKSKEKLNDLALAHDHNDFGNHYIWTTYSVTYIEQFNNVIHIVHRCARKWCAILVTLVICASPSREIGDLSNAHHSHSRKIIVIYNLDVLLLKKGGLVHSYATLEISSTMWSTIFIIIGAVNPEVHERPKCDFINFIAFWKSVYLEEKN